MSDTATSHVGYVIAWTAPASVTLTDLRAALTAAHFSPDLASDLRPLSLLARAATTLARARTGGNVRTLSRTVGQAHARQLTRETDQGNSLDYQREARLQMDTATRQIQSDVHVDGLAAVTVVVETTRTANDITRIVHHIVSEAGSDLIPVRPQGGAYFVPAARADLLDRIHTFLTSVGGSLTRLACTLGHGTDESVARTVADYLMRMVSELKDEVAELPDEVRADVKARRIARVGDLRRKLSQYDTLLGAMKSQVERAVTDATATLTAKLGEL